MKLADVPKGVFQGVLPGVLATVDRTGVPNVTYLSQVFCVDDGRVALSCQFFNKTKKNVLENPYACVELYDPQTLDTYRLDVRYDHAETEGPLFDCMSIRIDAIASHTGMTGVFKLLSSDVYEVLSIERVQHLDDPADDVVPDEPPTYRGEITGLQLVAQRVCRATDLEGLLATVLETLEQAFGFEHSMVLLTDETGDRLFAIASRGYGDSGVGAEVAMGEGLIGTVARQRHILRVAGVGAEIRYGRAIRAAVHRAGGPGSRALSPEIPLPGLVDAQSQLALPLIAGDRLVGVLAVESRATTAFQEWHEAYLEIITSQVAVAIENMVRKSRDAEALSPVPVPVPVPVPDDSARATRTRKFRFFADDGCVFVDDEYLVRNVPGKILWRILRTHTITGRTEFSNRELRLDATLGLPAVRDNLESRLVLLRKRLQQKCSDLALVPTGRGLFRLDTTCKIELEEAT